MEAIIKTWTKFSKDISIQSIQKLAILYPWMSSRIGLWIESPHFYQFSAQARVCEGQNKIRSLHRSENIWGKWLRFDAPWTCRITRPLSGNAAVERKAKNASIRGERVYVRAPRSPRSMTTWKVGARTNARAGAGKTEWRKKERSTFGLAVGGGRRTRDIARGWRVIDHEHSANTTWRRARWFSFGAKRRNPPLSFSLSLSRDKTLVSLFSKVYHAKPRKMEHDEHTNERLDRHLRKTC